MEGLRWAQTGVVARYERRLGNGRVEVGAQVVVGVVTQIERQKDDGSVEVSGGASSLETSDGRMIEGSRWSSSLISSDGMSAGLSRQSE
jgi:hypothetical protein